MPSRREFLASSAAGIAGVGVAGCLSGTGTLSAEWLSVKAISVEWTHNGRTHGDQILQLMSGGEGEIWGRLASEYDEVVSSPSEVTVSETVHDDLRSDFEAIEYGLGFCGGDVRSDDEVGCRNAKTSREDFNTVQFGDRAAVEVTDNRLHVHDVQNGSVSGWDIDVSEFEWSEKHGYPT